MNQKEWLELARGVKSAYAANSKALVDKTKLISVISAFEAVYEDRLTTNEEHFYLGKLIGTGRIEGTREQVLGTVNGAVERTIKFVANASSLDCGRAEIYSSVLVNCLDKEMFKSSLDVTLAKYRSTLEAIAKGSV